MKILFQIFFVLFLSLPVAAQTTIQRYVDTDCANNGNGTSGSCAASAGAAGAYNSMENAATDIDADFSDITAGGTDEIILLQAAGTAADTSSPDFTGVTTDADHYIHITCDNGKGDGCRPSSGGYSTSDYRLETSQYSCALCITGIGDVIISNIQIKSTCNDDCVGTAIRWKGTATGTMIAYNNWLLYAAATTPTTSGNSYAIDNVDNATTSEKSVIAVNNIIYDFIDGGIRCSTSSTDGTGCVLYNNTIGGLAGGAAIGLDLGLSGTNDAIYIKNNLVQNVGGDDYHEDSAASTEVTVSNITEDSTSPDGPAFRNKTVTFENEGADDFHLDAADNVAGNHCNDLSADPIYSLSQDIDLDARTGSWDCGADESVSGVLANSAPKILNTDM